jgi:glucokinase
LSSTEATILGRSIVTTAEPALIADIGGTNARFALVDLVAATPQIEHAMSLRTADYASLQHAAEHYLASHGVKPQRAALAVAAPVASDEIRLTNRAWSFSRSELQRSLGLRQLILLNDFGAVAWAVPTLNPADRVLLHGSDQLPLEGPVSVLGPGTGLGVALLVGTQASGWQVVETEGGHVSFAPLGDEEHCIARWLTARYAALQSSVCSAAPVCRISMPHCAGQIVHRSLVNPRPCAIPPTLLRPRWTVMTSPRAARWRASARSLAASPGTLR